MSVGGLILAGLLEHVFDGLTLFGQALLQLRVEAREVELVQLPQIGSVGKVHGVEPVHQLVGNILAKKDFLVCLLDTLRNTLQMFLCSIIYKPRNHYYQETSYG